MEKQERRRHQRCNRPVSIVYSIFNRTKQRAAVALQLNRLEACILSRTEPCPQAQPVSSGLSAAQTSENLWGGGSKGKPSEKNQETRVNCKLCQELKTLVVAEVKRCDKSEGSGTEHYGIGVPVYLPGCLTTDK
ncbi:MAG: hypothetical protein U5R30_01010 [Deltaproteobacteria bacterium]|nr:hypothetical protein [Deltaproteobacteria bacterium]